jgi:hypothetical protein
MSCEKRVAAIQDATRLLAYLHATAPGSQVTHWAELILRGLLREDAHARPSEAAHAR